MLDWKLINREGISIECANEEETIEFLKECECNNINWKSGLKATESCKCYRTISTNGGKFLTEEPNNIIVEFEDVKQIVRIVKMCKNEKIVCEPTPDNKIYVKKHYDLDGTLKKQKYINLDDNRICGRFQSSVQRAFEVLITNGGYERI